MDRKTFIVDLSLATAGMLTAGPSLAGNADFPVVRPPLSRRKFTSPAVEQLIVDFTNSTANRELAWLFGNCFPNTLDTTVDFSMQNGRPDTYVITGDIDAMWLRDSSAQVWPYLPLMKQDSGLQQLISGVINRQTRCILKDPYANAFYKDEDKVSEWKKTDLTDMKPGIHERKWEIDSLCYPVRLGYGYWKATGDQSPFDKDWNQAMHLIIQTFREQQRKQGQGPYSFQRETSWATDGVAMSGYGYPAKYTGMIYSMFRPSDDATVFPFLIPSNCFALVILGYLSEMALHISKDRTLARESSALADELKNGIDNYGTVIHPRYGSLYVYETNGFGSHHLMDDANIPSLLSLPYLQYASLQDVIYRNTRDYVLSEENPFFFKGSAGEGTGGPHAGKDMIWPLGVCMRALTSTDDREIKFCLQMLQHSNAGTGYMHESFQKDDVSNFTRKWFAWANTLFGELVWKIFREKPYLLS